MHTSHVHRSHACMPHSPHIPHTRTGHTHSAHTCTRHTHHTSHTRTLQAHHTHTCTHYNLTPHTCTHHTRTCTEHTHLTYLTHMLTSHALHSRTHMHTPYTHMHTRTHTHQLTRTHTSHMYAPHSHSHAHAHLHLHTHAPPTLLLLCVRCGPGLAVCWGVCKPAPRGVGARPGRVTGTAGERRCVQGRLDSAAVTTGPSSGPQPTARPAHGGPAGHHPPAPWQNAPVANDSASQNSCLRVMHVISTHISLARASDRLTPHVESPEEEEATRQAQKAVQCMH